MRFILVICFLGFQATATKPLHAQTPLRAQTTAKADDTVKPSSSSEDAPQDVAFFYGVHNGADLVDMLAGSKLARQMDWNSQIHGLKETITQSLDSNEFGFGEVKINFDDAAESTSDVFSKHQEDLRSLAWQMLAEDAVLIGDESWSTTWQAICQSVTIAKNDLTLVADEQGDDDSFKIEGADELLASVSFAKICVPNTILAFELTDTTPATRLLDALAKTLDGKSPQDLGGWNYAAYATEAGTLSLFALPLDQWLKSFTNEKELDAKEVAEQAKLQKIFRGRSLQVAIGLQRSRFIVFVGEDITKVDGLLSTKLFDRCKNQNETVGFDLRLSAALPGADESLIMSAYVSDRFAKSADALGDDGLMSNLTSFASGVGGTARMDDMPLQQAAMAFGIPPEFWTRLGTKLKSISKRWDDLALPKAGWAATISAGPSGIIGRSISLSVDPRLPDTPLVVDQHVGDDVIAFYASQGSAKTERLLLGYEFVSEVMIGYTKLMLSMFDDDDAAGDPSLHIQRLEQMPLRLAKIVRDRLLPALGDGGQAVVLTRFDPTPDKLDNLPIEISFVSRVANHQELLGAGDSLRQWANSLVNQYYQIIKKMDPDEADLEVPSIAPPISTDDGDSRIFTLAQLIGDDEPNPEEVLLDEPPIEIAVVASDDWDLSSLGTLFHWRLCDDVLAMGTNVWVTKKMLAAKPPIDSHRDLDPQGHSGIAAPGGIIRAVTWVDADQIAKIFDGVVDHEDGKTAQDFAKLIRCVDSFHAITATQDGKTMHRWKLTTPLGQQ